MLKSEILNPKQIQNSKFQISIASPFSLSGIGIHSGQPAKIKVKPTKVNAGIVFVKGREKIRASTENVGDTRLGTFLRGVGVVEHFLAAAGGLGIDNLEIEVEGGELPILDGSAKLFVEAFLQTGLVEQAAPKIYYEVDRPIVIEEKNAFLKALPFHGFRADFVINFEGIGEQSFAYDAEKSSFREEIAPARTFGYLEEHAALKEQGLARGASAENALILSKKGYVNPPRFKDEPVRHKILDLIGDLALLGGPLHAQISAFGSGHRMNVELVRRILAHG